MKNPHAVALGKLRAAKRSSDEQVEAAKAPWDGLTEDERSAEMRRRIALRRPATRRRKRVAKSNLLSKVS